MHHAIYVYGMSERQLECAFGLNNDLRWPADGEDRVLSFSYEAGTHTTAPEE